MGVDFILISPEQYEGPSGLTYRSCGLEKAYDIYRMEAPVNSIEIASGVRLISISQTQQPPLKTHVLLLGGTILV